MVLSVIYYGVTPTNVVATMLVHEVQGGPSELYNQMIK